MSVSPAPASRLLRRAWAAPASLLGLALALPLLLRGARASVVGGVLEIAARPAPAQGPPRRRPRHGLARFGAITFGHVVIGRDATALAALRAHERVHVAQYERLGPLFLPLYLASSARAWLAGGDPYRDNRFEREAFAHDHAVARASGRSAADPAASARPDRGLR